IARRYRAGGDFCGDAADRTKRVRDGGAATEAAATAMSPRGRSAKEGKRTAILDAALRLFGRYGYRRTSIDDIANEAEIPKGTVYLGFKGRGEIFRAVCEGLSAGVRDKAERARPLDDPLQARVLAILEAKFGLYFEVVGSPAHAAELMDSKNRLSDDLFEK